MRRSRSNYLGCFRFRVPPLLHLVPPTSLTFPRPRPLTPHALMRSTTYTLIYRCGYPFARQLLSENLGWIFFRRYRCFQVPSLRLSLIQKKKGKKKYLLKEVVPHFDIASSKCSILANLPRSCFWSFTALSRLWRQGSQVHLVTWPYNTIQSVLSLSSPSYVRQHYLASSLNYAYQTYHKKLITAHNRYLLREPTPLPFFITESSPDSSSFEYRAYSFFSRSSLRDI